LYRPNRRDCGKLYKSPRGRGTIPCRKTLTKDTVPVDVDAVLYWLVWDAQKAALEVADYTMAIS
jgi:regulator of protease activity HflC (stomatin/prohibitin superfamily)